jgi:hypothetical protein
VSYSSSWPGWRSPTGTTCADGFIRGGKDIKLLKCKTWEQYADKFVPLVRNRMFDAATIVVDSYSFLSDQLVKRVGGADGKVTIPGWGQIKNDHLNKLTDLISATQPLDGKPSYNIVVTCHLMKDGSEDSDGALVPSIMGSFKYEIGKCFGSVFVTKPMIKQQVGEGEMKGKLVPGKPAHLMYTVPPDERYACGDGVGGKGGIEELPTIIGNTYPELMKAWGLKTEGAK